MLEDELLKNIVSGFRRLIILKFLSEKPMHGYEIKKKLEKLFGVSYPSSIIYPLLRDLEKRGYIESGWRKTGKRKRRQYNTTRDGKRVLASSRRTLEKPARDALIAIIGGEK